jgi:transposase
MNFIPPYSPWYNPVENAFAQAKARFQKLRLRSSDFVSDIMDSVASVRNFHGMFESASRMWAEDVSST